MADEVFADARPEKRLFISLITRDISLADAFLDLIDNSINAALEPLATHLRTADDYERFLADIKLRPNVVINLTVGPARLVVQDTAPGISAETAEKHVFRFGRDDTEAHESDRLSVYGIGLKRAMFKCGNKIEIVSNHRDGGFELRLDVKKWAKEQQDRWQFKITRREPRTVNTGTKIVITELHMK